jgi:hypothetical protein
VINSGILASHERSAKCALVVLQIRESTAQIAAFSALSTRTLRAYEQNITDCWVLNGGAGPPTLTPVLGGKNQSRNQSTLVEASSSP